MRVIEISGAGGVDVLRLAERPRPELCEGQVLIEVVAAGVNGPDLLQRKGLYPPPRGASDLPGLEVSGRIVAVCGDTGWSVGDEVCALTNGGGYAQFVAVEGCHCFAIPEGVDLVDAAGLPETYMTVWSNLFLHQTPAPGARLLVHGGAGGIGSTAILLGKALGLEVFATASVEDREYCTGLGADRVIDYRDEDFVAITREAGGADVILDIVGGDYIARNIKAARTDARIVQLAFRAGSKVEIDLMPVMLKRLTFTGATLRSRPAAFKAETVADLSARAWPLFASGALRPVTHKVLPFDAASEAHAMMEQGAHRGKILLKS